MSTPPPPSKKKSTLLCPFFFVFIFLLILCQYTYQMLSGNESIYKMTHLLIFCLFVIKRNEMRCACSLKTFFVDMSKSNCDRMRRVGMWASIVTVNRSATRLNVRASLLAVHAESVQIF